MATIRNFEDLEAWKKARELAGYVYALTRQAQFSRDFGLANQIQRAASSVMHNIAEGFEAGYNAEFIRFLKLARRSASETQSELYLALDMLYITAGEFTQAYQLAVESKKLINGLIAYLNKRKPSTNQPTN